MNGLILNSLKPPSQIFQEEGILFYPQLFRGEELQQLLSACDFVLQQFCGENAANTSARVMRHLEESRWHRQARQHQKVLLETVANPRCLGPVEQIFEGHSLFRCTSLFFNPTKTSQEGEWHRDLQFLVEREEEVQTQIAEAKPVGIQLQIALVDNDDIEFVPFSATRYDSPEEYSVRCADGRSHNRKPMPGAMRVAQNAGDAIIFNPNGLHRGRYHCDKPRRTLMLTYTPRCRPVYDKFSQHPWMLDADYLQHVSSRARVYLEDFAQLYRSSWAINKD